MILLTKSSRSRPQFSFPSYSSSNFVIKSRFSLNFFLSIYSYLFISSLHSSILLADIRSLMYFLLLLPASEGEKREISATFAWGLKLSDVFLEFLLLSKLISLKQSLDLSNSSSFKIWQCLFRLGMSSSSSDYSCRITSIIFMEQSRTYSIFPRTPSTLRFLLYCFYLVSTLPISNLSFLQSYSNPSKRCLLFSANSAKAYSCSTSTNILESSLALPWHLAYSSTSPSVSFTSTQHSLCISLSRYSILDRNSRISLSFFSKSRVYPLYLLPSGKTVLNILSSRKAASQRESRSIGWSLCMGLQAVQKRLQWDWHCLFMQRQEWAIALAPFFYDFWCLRQSVQGMRKNDKGSIRQQNAAIRVQATIAIMPVL